MPGTREKVTTEMTARPSGRTADEHGRLLISFQVVDRATSLMPWHHSMPCSNLGTREHVSSTPSPSISSRRLSERQAIPRVNLTSPPDVRRDGSDPKDL